MFGTIFVHKQKHIDGTHLCLIFPYELVTSFFRRKGEFQTFSMPKIADDKIVSAPWLFGSFASLRLNNVLNRIISILRESRLPPVTVLVTYKHIRYLRLLIVPHFRVWFICTELVCPHKYTSTCLGMPWMDKICENTNCNLPLDWNPKS